MLVDGILSDYVCVDQMVDVVLDFTVVDADSGAMGGSGSQEFMVKSPVGEDGIAYCDDCGHQELEMDVCPKCGSRNLTKIDRMNGYLSYSRVHGDTRLNDAKMAEIAERKSM